MCGAEEVSGWDPTESDCPATLDAAGEEELESPSTLLRAGLLSRSTVSVSSCSFFTSTHSSLECNYDDPLHNTAQKKC